MANPLFPDVPITVGVPAVLRRALADISAREDLADAERLDAFDQDMAQQWGVYSQASSRRILEPDSIVAVESDSEYRISDYPIEGGKFESYNKVATPGSIRVTMTKGGTREDRSAFLAAIHNIRTSNDLVDIYTPELIYQGYNAERIGSTRNATNGATMLTVEVIFREIRQNVSIKFSDSKTAAGADDVSGGTVQPTSEAVAKTPPTPERGPKLVPVKPKAVAPLTKAQTSPYLNTTRKVFNALGLNTTIPFEVVQ